MKDVILEIREISKSFGRNKVLTNITIDVYRNEIHAIVGENGAGKSTLMKCLFGIYTKDSGEFILDGMKINFANP